MPERGPPTTWRSVRANARAAWWGALLSAALALLLIASAQSRAATVAEQLGRLPVVQQFTGDASSTAAFAANWTAFQWASGKGSDTTTGWRVSPAYPTEEAAFHSAAQYTAATGGAAAALTMAVNPGTLNTGRFFSLWVDTTTEALGARSGYELRFTATGLAVDAYDVTLAKWQAGTRTVFATQLGVRLVNGNVIALTDDGASVTAWTNTGAGFAALVGARDASFDQGYAGLGGAGNITRLTGFKAGQLAPAAPSLTSTSPRSPANDNAPKIVGSAPAGTTVKLYANATCTGSPAATGTAAALASPGIAVSVADNTTTTFYATATDTLGNASDCSASGISYTERTTGGTGIAAGLEGLATLDAFATTENPLSGGGKWSVLSAASHVGQVVGSGETAGWSPYNAYPAVHGAFWNQESFEDDGAGVAVAATLPINSTGVGHYVSLWLDMPAPESAQSGYEVRFTRSTTAYDVSLSKWQGGTRTVLATGTSPLLSAQGSLALVDQGGTVSVWTNSGSGFVQLLEARDATFERGHVGIEGAGNARVRARLFRAGVLPAESQLLANLPSVDAFETAENPLSRGGAWKQTSGAVHAGQVSGSGTTGGWGPWNAFPSVHGAYWSAEPFSDGGEGAAAAATLATSPSAAERYFSLWLDMPRPGDERTGYELRFMQTATTNTYDVTLSKWQAGTRTELARAANYPLAPQSSFAVLDRGGVVSAWTNTGSGFRQQLAVSDASFASGYAGVESAGNITRVRDFRAGDDTLGFPGVKRIGQAEAEYDPVTQTYSYKTEPNAAAATGHVDPVDARGSYTPLPEEKDAVACVTSGHRIKVVYSTPASPAVPSAAVVDQITDAVLRMNSKFVRESRNSSGNARALVMRVDCDANGNINVYGQTTFANDYESIATGVLGSTPPSGADAVKYLVFREAQSTTDAAGQARVRTERAEKTSADDAGGNWNRINSTAAVIWRSFWNTHASTHEIVHAMGAVMGRASTPPPDAYEGHCSDGIDIMCYGPVPPYSETECPAANEVPLTRTPYQDPKHIPLDCGKDTYFNASLTPGGWLETHWNVGGPENPFLVERPAEIPPGGADTTTGITLREVRDGPPGSVSVYGHVTTTNAGGHVVNNAYVNVNFQKWDGTDWETLEEHTVHPVITNGYYEANSVATLGVGRWRLRAVLPKQGYYNRSESPSYHEFEIDLIPTTAFITLDSWQNGAPGTASLHGHVKRTGNEAPASGRVKVNFQKLVGGTWTTQTTADRTLDGNGYWEVVDWGVGVGSWRVRAVFDQQDGYAYAESDYRTFDIQPVPTEAPITLVGFQNGTPGTASLQGHIRRASNRAPASGRVKVNFQKLVGGTWTTMSTADRTLDGNGFWEVTNWGVGVGSWRARAVYDQQGDYAYVESEYRTFDIQPVPTYAPITLDGWQNGAPGTASLHGHILRVGNNAPARGNVNVNFQKWNGSSWQTMSTAVRTLDGNGYWGVSNWGVGVGSWRVRAVFDQQGDYAYTESEYRSFDIQQVATSSYLTVNQVINGSPGRVNVSGNTLWAGGGACCGVNVNFQKLINGTWQTQSTATPGLSNGSWSVSNWGVGVGSWRVRSVFNAQGDFAYSESPYHGFTINR